MWIAGEGDEPSCQKRTESGEKCAPFAADEKYGKEYRRGELDRHSDTGKHASAASGAQPENIDHYECSEQDVDLPEAKGLRNRFSKHRR